MGKKLDVLPDSRSKEFWGDSKTIKCDPEIITIGQIHKWKQQGPLALCTSCPNHHGIFLDILNEEVRNGEIYNIKTNEIVYGRERESAPKTSNS
jgi:hypothetical protein